MEYVTLRTALEVKPGIYSRIRRRGKLHQIVGIHTACGRRITDRAYEWTRPRPTDSVCVCCQEGRRR